MVGSGVLFMRDRFSGRESGPLRAGRHDPLQSPPARSARGQGIGDLRIGRDGMGQDNLAASGVLENSGHLADCPAEIIEVVVECDRDARAHDARPHAGGGALSASIILAPSPLGEGWGEGSLFASSPLVPFWSASATAVVTAAVTLSKAASTPSPVVLTSVPPPRRTASPSRSSCS